MVLFSDRQVPARVWRRRAAFFLFSVVSTALILVAVLAATLILSDVLMW